MDGVAWFSGHVPFRFAAIQGACEPESLRKRVQEWFVWYLDGKPILQLSMLVWSEQDIGAFVSTEVVAYKHDAKRYRTSMEVLARCK